MEEQLLLTWIAVVSDIAIITGGVLAILVVYLTRKVKGVKREKRVYV